MALDVRAFMGSIQKMIDKKFKTKMKQDQIITLRQGVISLGGSHGTTVSVVVQGDSSQVVNMPNYTNTTLVASQEVLVMLVGNNLSNAFVSHIK